MTVNVTLAGVYNQKRCFFGHSEGPLTRVFALAMKSTGIPQDFWTYPISTQWGSPESDEFDIGYTFFNTPLTTTLLSKNGVFYDTIFSADSKDSTFFEHGRLLYEDANMNVMYYEDSVNQ
eukprot:TRINITY_DN2886_c0_g1_i1.p1 TRINITY_DN2886_c0_g1~~TRINITY_DN2886_c0_g1_i1.p1  ORF type:complete len:120 (-),score=7.00 TRINITY_DN2886_c0_g1_i1:246-605(-)